MYRIIKGSVAGAGVALVAVSAALASDLPTIGPDTAPIVIRPYEATPGHQFRLVKVQPRIPGERIDVQINPEEQFSVEVKVDPKLPPRPFDPPLDGAVGQESWFWSGLSTRLADGDPLRMQEAMAMLTSRPSGNRALRPDERRLRALADKYGRDIQKGTSNLRVSPALVLAVMGVESAGNPNAVSHVGATGLMQLIPETAKRFGVKEIRSPTENIAGGAAYLDWLLTEFRQDPLLALAGYNAGENAVKKFDGIPPFAETRLYVPKVVAAWQVARNLCQTPPDYVWQGCDFKRAGVQ